MNHMRKDHCVLLVASPDMHLCCTCCHTYMPLNVRLIFPGAWLHATLAEFHNN